MVTGEQKTWTNIYFGNMQASMWMGLGFNIILYSSPRFQIREFLDPVHMGPLLGIWLDPIHMEAFENVACLSLVRAFFLLVGEPCILMGAHLRIDGVEISTEKQIYNACGCHSITFLKRTCIFGWCVVRWGSKNKHHKKHIVPEIKHALLIIITEWREIRFSIVLCVCFIIDLIMKYKFEDANLINTRK